MSSKSVNFLNKAKISFRGNEYSILLVPKELKFMAAVTAFFADYAGVKLDSITPIPMTGLDAKSNKTGETQVVLKIYLEHSRAYSTTPKMMAEYINNYVNNKENA